MSQISTDPSLAAWWHIGTRIVTDVGLAGLTAPLLRVQCIQQTQRELLVERVIKSPFKNVNEVLAHVIRNEGQLGQWRGFSALAARSVFVPAAATGFFASGFARTLFGQAPQNSFVENVLITGTMLCIKTLCERPFDYMHQRLATDLKSKERSFQFRRLADVFHQTSFTDGTLGLYRGVWASCAGNLLNCVMFFGMLQVFPSASTAWGSAALALSTTCVSSFLEYPLDTISRRRMMMVGGDPKYAHGSCRALARHVWRHENPLHLYAGLPMFLGRFAFNTSALYLVNRQLQHRHDDS